MTAALYETLREITTATITTMLLKKGIRRCWMDGPQPLVPGGQRLVGPAFTLRFVPVREDLATPESWSKPISTRGAIEAMPEGCIAVADAMGVGSAGIFGDILTMRMMKQDVTALVTDGV
jgi:regulator of RNase E activity RraA